MPTGPKSLMAAWQIEGLSYPFPTSATRFPVKSTSSSQAALCISFPPKSLRPGTSGHLEVDRLGKPLQESTDQALLLTSRR